LQQIGISVIAGLPADVVEAHYDLAVLSPGIDPTFPIVQNFLRQGVSFIGELELSSRFCERPIVAITGTNGKTTTTQLIEAMLNGGGLHTLACGNIGIPFAEAVQRQEKFDVFTVEVSSFQLETISTFRPKVAVWLNLTPDHLDRYCSLEEYRAAKLRILQNQNSSDYAVTNRADDFPPFTAQPLPFTPHF